MKRSPFPVHRIIVKGSLLRARMRVKLFFLKKMPLCHLPCVYGGWSGGIMVALVAFSGSF